MRPVVKYQGGKTKELPIIKQLAPHFKRIVEPFCGGAAVSLSYKDYCLLNDLNGAVINLYGVIGSDEFKELYQRINEIKCYEHDELSALYYSSRDIINSSDKGTPLEWAIAYIVVRQLCFSGMERYNSDGEFNVPYGHYSKMSCSLSLYHHQFFRDKVTLSNGDAISIIEQCNEDDWIFLDPPYLDRLGYTQGDGGLELHNRLIDAMKATPAKWLFVHSDCEFYRDNLSEFNIITQDFKYMQNFGKGKDHSGSKVQHLYITNYYNSPAIIDSS